VEWTFEFNTDDYFFERSIGLQIILLFPMIESCRAGQIGLNCFLELNMIKTMNTL